VQLANLGQRGGGVMSVQTLDGNVFDAIVFGEQEPGRWLGRQRLLPPHAPLRGPVEKEADRPARSTSRSPTTPTAPSPPTATACPTAGPIAQARRSPSRRGAPGRLRLRHAPAGGNKMLAGTILRAPALPRPRPCRPKKSLSPPVCPSARPRSLARLSPAERKRRSSLQADLAHLQADVRRLETRLGRKVYTNVPPNRCPTHLLVRGSVTARGELVSAEALSSLARFGPAYRLAH